MGILFFRKNNQERQPYKSKERNCLMEYNTIFDDIFRDEENVKERFGEIMGGKVLESESDKLIRQGMERERENTERERQNTEKALQRVKEAEEEIRYLKRLLAEQEMKKNLK